MHMVAGAQPGHVTWKLLKTDIISTEGDLTAEWLMSEEITQDYSAVM